MSDTLFVVTFASKVSAKEVRQFCDAQFFGLCSISEPTEHPSMLNLWPTKLEYRTLKAQLVEFEEDGLLSFVESGR
jgi:hypothetical protein